MDAEKLRLIIESAQDVIFTLSPEGRFESLNTAFETITGWSTQEWIGQAIKPLISPPDLPKVLETFELAFKGQTIPSLTAGLLKKWGGKVIVDATLVPEITNGQVTRVHGIARNVTEKIEAEEQRLKLAQEETLRREAEAARERALFLFKASSHMFSSLDQETNAASLAKLAVAGFADWSVVYLTGSGSSPASVATATAHLWQEDQVRELEQYFLPAKNHQHPLKKTIDSGISQLLSEIPLSQINDVAVEPDHRRLLVKLGFSSLMTVPIQSRGATLGAVMFVSGNPNKKYSEDDLAMAQEFGLRAGLALENTRLFKQIVQAREELARSEEELIKARDEALRHSQFKSNFVANLSHEIRTPINAIVGMTSLLNNSALSPQQHNYLETVRISCEALLSLINDILDLSKVEAGKLEVEKEDFDGVKIVESVMDLLAHRGLAKGLEMVCTIDPHLPSRLRGDAGRLRQILMNMGSNAVKFTPRGEVVMSVKTLEETDSHAKIRFSVRDTGVGIPKDKLAQIFEPFHQVSSGLQTPGSGTGLGLTIAKMFVELMGGTIHVESERNRGAHFWVDIPFEKQPALPASAGAPRRDALSMLRVLVADDNQSSRESLINQMKAWGVKEVEGVSIPAMALNRLRDAVTAKRPFNIILIDKTLLTDLWYHLPNEIKSDPELKKLKVVAMTPLHQPLDTREMKDLNISSNLLKPIKGSALLSTLTGETKRIKRASTVITKTQKLDIPRCSILVAEDNSINQQVVLWQLKELGFQADAVGNGVEALEAFNRYPYNLILMDCQMPDMDGFQATGEIRRVEKKGTRIPIIAMTAHAMKGVRERCLKSGMDDCIIKPVSTEDLRNVLIKWVVKPVQPTEFKERLLPEFKDPKVKNDMVRLFLDITPKQLEILSKGVENKNFKAIENEAHRLAGSFGAMGFENAMNIARDLEKMAEKKKLTKIPDLVEDLKKEYEGAERWAYETLEK